MTKTERKFNWLKVIHILEDIDISKISNLHKVIDELDKKFSLKERKVKEDSIN